MEQLAVMLTVQGPVPLQDAVPSQSPDQLLNEYPVSGVAVSTTVAPWA
jgi:hypothetical protein